MCNQKICFRWELHGCTPQPLVVLCQEMSIFRKGNKYLGRATKKYLGFLVRNAQLE